ncbi:MAG: adenylate/guanylate cyclase domain-containing protein [Alphaproteobacteria bacterium]|nr:adenylate/guanylate cyclase domain-containing protein [Alphaproteobacteria bacterium]
MSNRLVESILLQLEREHGAALVSASCDAAGLPRIYFEDPNGWVSNRYHHALIQELVVRALHLPEPPDRHHPFWEPWREAGRRGFSPERLGPFLPILRTFGSTSSVLRNAPSIVQRFNSTLSFRVLQQGTGQAMVEIGPTEQRPEHAPNVGNCWTRIGILEGLPTLWGLPQARVEHEACVFDKRHPAPTCVYRVTYADPPIEGLSHFWFPALTLALLGLGWGLGWLAPSAMVVGAFGALASLVLRKRRRALDTQRALEIDKLLLASEARYRQLWREGEALRRAYLATRKLSGYLPEPLVEEVLKDPEMERRLGGTRIEAAVLFADIVGFTPRCERLDAEDILQELNLYFTAIDEVIQEHGGVVDKRMGDGVMVVFPLRIGESLPELRRRAVACGLAMLGVIPEVNAQLQAIGSAPMEIRIGLSAGPLVQGNMGSQRRMEYTVVGAVVNLASRMEELARPGCLLMPARQLEDAAPPERIVGRRSERVKGFTGWVELIELAPESGEPELSEWKPPATG